MLDLGDAKIASLCGSWWLMLDALRRAGVEADLDVGQGRDIDVTVRVADDIYVEVDDTGWRYIRVEGPDEDMVRAAYHAALDAHHQEFLDVQIEGASQPVWFRICGGFSSCNPNPGGWVKVGLGPIDWLQHNAGQIGNQ